MARKCAVTGKGPKVVNRVTRRGKARAAGGVGKKTTGITKRVQKPNLQKRRVRVNGEVKHVWLSTKALRKLPAGMELA